jgi:hypothetical protein
MSDQNTPQPPADDRPPNPVPTPPVYGAPAPLDDAQTRQWAGLAHLGGILGVLPSLIIWLVFRERSGFVDQEAKKALNFQITVLIGYLAASILGMFIPFVSILSFAIWVTSLVFSVQGYQAVQRGQAFKYPFTLDLIK